MRLWVLVAAFLILAGNLVSAQESHPPPAAASAAPGQAGAASVDDLVRILEDDKLRADLLQRLKQRQPGQQAPAAAAPQAEAEPGFARSVAEYTKAIAEQSAGALSATIQTFRQLGSIVSGESQVDMLRLRDVGVALGFVALALFGSFLIARLLAERVQAGLARRVAGSSWPARSAGLVVAVMVDLAGVALAWGAGYLLVLNLVGTAGRITLEQTLLLNAFLAVEIVKVAMRAVLEPRHPALRLMPIDDTTAAYWYFWLARLISLLGYTFLFVAPALALYLPAAAVQALKVLVMLTALVIAIVIILQNRLQVRRRLFAAREAGRHDLLAQASHVAGQFWHVVVVTYLIGVFLVWLVNPLQALPFVLGATVQSVVIAILGGVVLAFVSRLVNVSVRLPEDVRLRLPLLEPRLQAFAPRVMQIVRLLVLAAVLLLIVQAWHVLDIFAWLASASGQRLAGALVSAALIVLIGLGVYVAMLSWVEYRLNPDFGTVPTAREKTLLALFRNAFTVALAVLVLMLALAQLGLNIAPLLAGAGVLGLAIGFGAQKLVQDIITGVFIQFENVMNEGDVVQVGGKSGVVERLTIRSVSIRSLDGTVHLIPFSSVDHVSNMMRGFSFHVAEIGVAYRENIPEVKEAMEEAFERLKDTEHGEKIIGPLDMQGITAFGDSAITVRARIKTLPGAQWGAGRAYNEFIKEIFDRRGIEIPFPHVTLYMGEDKQGKAPPLHVQGRLDNPARPTAPAAKGPPE
ncbi:mechanosensitive ion channel domain-containing protein [Bosea sp. ANAM02]|uniref:mechanosensitive ion channel domain-containing protein n=1 Tax=Bosea sp. ANAM02 TaxID=2020412 RepID=UPI0015678FF1|nr:mechanosensitive ion channel domain-containing protein [Bosea sp. ANAM02]